MTGGAAWQLLLVIATLRTVRGIEVSSFAELKLAVDSGISPISIASSQITFLQHLDVREDRRLTIDGALRKDQAYLREDQAWWEDARLLTTLWHGPTLSGDDSTRFFYLHNSSLSLRGLELARGYCLGCDGGAIFLSSGSKLLLTSVLISANRADDGGAIYAISSTLIMTNCSMSDNYSAARGGAVSLFGNSTLVASGCTMTSNSAVKGGAVFAGGESTVTTTDCVMTSNVALNDGGAVDVSWFSSFTATHCTMTSNSADQAGGALHTDGFSTVTARDCTMTSNSAVWGGAVHVEELGSITAFDCTMTSNTAHSSGGVVDCQHFSTVYLIACSMMSNHASSWGAKGGGALFVEGDSVVVVTDCTLTSNYAILGGAVDTRGDATLTAVGCTLSSNTGNSGGGAVYAVSLSTVTAVDCVLTSNVAPWGGTVHAQGESIVNATDCTIAGNVAEWGGFVYAGEYATIITTDCSMIANSAKWGGAVYANAASAIIATDCTMTSNSAQFTGGAVIAKDFSTVTTTNCTMTSNSAFYWGGAVGTGQSAAVIARDCAMTSNSAKWGGAVGTYGASSIAVINCTMNSNVALNFGGAVYAEEYSTVTTVASVMTSNSALGGGAVFASDNSSLSATDCSFSSNRADGQGGGLFLYGSNGSLAATMVDCRLWDNTASSGGALVVANGCFSHIRASRFESNSADAVGGAIVVHRDGTLELVDSLFASNVAGNETDDGVGVVNLGGQLFCDTHGCLSVCTACRDETEEPSPSPAPVAMMPVPTVPVTMPWARGSMPPTRRAETRKSWPLIGTCAVVSTFLLLVVIVGTWVHRRTPTTCFAREVYTAQPTQEDSRWGIQLNLNSDAHQDLLMPTFSRDDSAARGDGSVASSEVSRDDSGYSSAMISSPAPIFVVNRDMRVKEWSPGMKSAAPLPVDPVGCLLSELPFVNQRSGRILCTVIREMFDTPEQTDHRVPERIMLYLHTKSGRPVLFEMAAHVAGTGTTKVVIVAGRQVESDLGGLIATGDGDVPGGSEATCDCKGGNGYDGELSEACQSEISSLTAPTFVLSEVSSLAAPRQDSDDSTVVDDPPARYQQSPVVA